MPIAIQLAHAGRKASTRGAVGRAGADRPDEHRGWQTVAPSPIPFADSRAPAGRRSIVAGLAGSATRSLRRRSGPPGSGSMPSSSTAPTATCCTSSSRRSPTGATTSTAAAWKTGCAFRSKCSTRCATRSRPTGRSAMRVSGTDWAEGGWDIEQTIAFAQALEARGCGAIHVSSGGLTPAQQIPLGPELSGAAGARREGGDDAADHRGRPHHRATIRPKRSSAPATPT